jgi:CheY-like chemotaxis protein
MGAKSDVQNNKRYVLVVDANIVDRFSIGMLLQRFGYTIFTASTEEESINFMNIEAPAAVVAEAGLLSSPLLFRVRKEPRFSNIPFILLLSPNASSEDLSRKGEVAAVLRKPINVEEFYQVVQSVIEKGPRRNIRIPTRLTATLEDELTGAGGYVTLLSEEGMFFRSLEPRPMNTRIPVSFEINGRTILLEAIVLYRTTVNEGPLRESGMGMKFDKISPVDREVIKAFILERVREGLAPQRYQN